MHLPRQTIACINRKIWKLENALQAVAEIAEKLAEENEQLRAEVKRLKAQDCYTEAQHRDGPAG